MSRCACRTHFSRTHARLLPGQMRRWGFMYIENLTWVYLRPDNSILSLVRRGCGRVGGRAGGQGVIRNGLRAQGRGCGAPLLARGPAPPRPPPHPCCTAPRPPSQPGEYANCSHLTLYMFRKASTACPEHLHRRAWVGRGPSSCLPPNQAPGLPAPRKRLYRLALGCFSCLLGCVWQRHPYAIDLPPTLTQTLRPLAARTLSCGTSATQTSCSTAAFRSMRVRMRGRQEMAANS